jgi:hypothetical protein
MVVEDFVQPLQGSAFFMRVAVAVAVLEIPA